VVFSIQHERRVNPDNTIALDNRILQIEEPLRPFPVSPPGESRGGRRGGEQHRKYGGAAVRCDTKALLHPDKTRSIG